MAERDASAKAIVYSKSRDILDLIKCALQMVKFNYLCRAHLYTIQNTNSVIPVEICSSA